MAKELNVNPAGLRAAAASGEAAAAGLGGDAALSGSGCTQPSAAGVGAVNAALARVQGRQSARIGDQSSDLSVSGARYETTDGGGADTITTISV